MKIFLFDMDGVLIEPGGYRAAFIATMNYFGERMGMGEIAPTVTEIEGFEAQSITNEWDMISLSMANLVMGVAGQMGEMPASFEHFVNEVWRVGMGATPFAFPINYPQIATHIGSQWQRDQETPAETGLRLYSQNTPTSVLPLLKQLLAKNYDILNAPTTHIFQHYTLGSDAFQQTYQAPPLFTTESLLVAHDNAGISAEIAEQVMAQVKSGELYATIYTARPSLPPAGEDGFGYAPEAELATGLTGLALPLIGSGRVNWLSRQMGKPDGVFVKPSPVQALAAIGAAISGDERGALWAAESLARGEWDDFWEECRHSPLQIHVFEDSTGGIQAVQNAGKILESFDIKNRVIGHGIATTSHKIQSLERVANRVYGSVNEAIETALVEK